MGGGTGHLDKKQSKTELRHELVEGLSDSAICNGNASLTAWHISNIPQFFLTDKELSGLLERFTKFYTDPDGIEIARKDERVLMVKRNFAICAMTDMIIKTQMLKPYHTSLIIGFENNALNKSLVEYNWATLSPFIRRVLAKTESTEVAKAITMARIQIIQE